MLKEIIERYGDFGDAIIEKVECSMGAPNKLVCVTLNCMNSLNNYKYERIVLSFMDVSEVRYVQARNTDSTIVYKALCLEEDGEVTIDFYPDNNGNKWEINETSDCLIRSKKIELKVM
ncbi:hypothetical protein [Chitinophaga sp. sic0106]|uniref:hypothetical protein n=1 Tax=Chitinophaga sp. sic0106 TaxID=2854785 RepID=UPI001C466E8C|nr:hypothetical protein [Chitinophaga sp. sic0106]MBV7530949.1 hypothetical protein [Chitinophaga sp. sic0106]